MNEVLLEIFLIILRLFFVFFFPFALGKGLWKLGIKKKGISFKEFYGALLYLTASGVCLFYLARLVLR